MTPAPPLTDHHFVSNVLICHRHQLSIIASFSGLPMLQHLIGLSVVTAICSSWFNACGASREHAHSLGRVMNH